MAFTTDKQTLTDLGIFGKPGSPSVYALFNRTQTSKGAAVLEEMFTYPLSNQEAIEKRSNLFRFFGTKKMSFPFPAALFDASEQYLAETDERTKLTPEDQSSAKKLASLITADTKFKGIQKGVLSLIEIAHLLQLFIRSLNTGNDTAYSGDQKYIEDLLAEPAIQSALQVGIEQKLSYETTAALDEQFRFRYPDKWRQLLQCCYQLDVYISVAQVAVALNYCFPAVKPVTENVLVIQGLFHPLVANAVSNNFQMIREKNMVFLTGANMAGKSTFMKSVGIAVFLAQMGFPVPAKHMELSVLDGIFTAINLPDNLGMGASHFYAEVLRVKKVAKELQSQKKLFVMFDELFRGTNVKDAYEATIEIVNAFALNHRSKFIISTHIIEAGAVLREKNPAISFQYLPTKMNGNTPVYTYRLENGITADRHGMVIIHNEGILELLQKPKTQIPG
ncbi:MutS-related protein [Chitinophaga defluvii]|uniref:DNA mismatch repair protein n=1 Tax=Chitinophaga defluvii TaxID=3163343 RepID=A0ABV2TBE1_9BACT